MVITRERKNFSRKAQVLKSMKYLLIDVLLAPVLGIVIGSILLFVVGYINWHKGTKEKSVSWIQSKIFQNSFDNKNRAEGLFGVITSLLLAAGGIMIVVSIFILSNV